MTATQSFAARITRCPDAFDSERAAEALEGYGDLPQQIRDVIRGTGGSSPYLRGLLARERDWASENLAKAPEAAAEGTIRALAELDFAGLSVGLRQAKRRIALLTALADLAGVWSLDEVTGTLTRFADAAVDRAITVLVENEQKRRKMPQPERPAPANGMCVIDMGKMGAYELNYSSDIDLICLFDDSLYHGDAYLEVRPCFVRITRQMTQILSETTSEGYVFRTDLRLRPDASVTPVCLPMEAAERYYESMGRTWERAAYIKARAGSGDIVAGQGFLERIGPFVWRRHLDYAAIQDAQDMRLRIRSHKGISTGAALPGYDLKLGPGGIREIEFFTQTRQIVAGGRDPSLRLRGTVEALNRLSAAGWIEKETAETLTIDYRAHREIEHRIQMVADQQTHSLPRDSEGFERIACLAGKDAAALKSEISDRLDRVAALTDDFFAPTAPRRPETELSETAREIVERWPTYPALRSARAIELFDRVRPEMLARLGRATNPDEALRHIDGFLAGLPAGVQLFSLFNSNPQLIDLIVDIADVSPDLARFLSRNSGVFDAVIGGSFFEPWPGREALSAELSGWLSATPDYERQLDLTRIWSREWRFRVGVHLLRDLITADHAGAQYADIAAATLTAVTDPVITEFARKHGDPPGRGVAFLGLGSLGAGRLTATSDLDIIAIYDPQGAEGSDGKRKLPTRTYFARLTQAFVTAITAQTAEGRLYDVDMRLRPSGRQGPVATSLEAFRNYHRTEAWTWEHLALTRARHIAGNPELGADIEAVRREVLALPHDRQAVLRDVSEMRGRLAAAKPLQGPLDPKFGPGRMQDIELLAQAGALLASDPARDVPDQIAAGQGVLKLSDKDVADLLEAYALFWRAQSSARLIGEGAGHPETLGAGARRFLTGRAGAGDIDDLVNQLAEAARIAEGILNRCLGRPDKPA